jgi:hypothetical protein
MRRLVLLPSLLVLVLAACDPCAGMAACGKTRISYEGVLSQVAEYPVEDIRVEFFPTGGVPIDPPILIGRPNARGQFRLEGWAAEAGEVEGVVRFFPEDGGPAEAFSGIRLRPTDAAGNVFHLGTWRVIGNRLAAIGQLFQRADFSPTVGAEIEFRRVSGPRLQPDTFVVRSDANGRFPLRSQAAAAGEVVADLVVRPRPPYNAFTIRGVRTSTRFIERVGEEVVGIWGVGPYLPYIGILVFGDTGEQALGVEVEFRRTGGIATQPQGYVTRVREGGIFGSGTVVPLEYGELIGEIVVRPPAPYRSFTIPNIRLQTIEETLQHAIVVGTWEIPLQ